jgi:hypothetical protein
MKKLLLVIILVSLSVLLFAQDKPKYRAELKGDVKDSTGLCKIIVLNSKNKDVSDSFTFVGAVVYVYDSTSEFHTLVFCGTISSLTFRANELIDCIKETHKLPERYYLEISVTIGSKKKERYPHELDYYLPPFRIPLIRR